MKRKELGILKYSSSRVNVIKTLQL